MQLPSSLAAVFLIVPLFACPSSTDGTPPTPGPTPAPSPAGGRPGLKLVDIIPASLSGETNQDSEPFLAIHTVPTVLAASAFTPNPEGASSLTAPIFISFDGGDTWNLNAIIPSTGTTCDVTHAFGGGAANLPRGRLYNGILRNPCSFGTTLRELDAADIGAGAQMRVDADRNDVDQPFVQVVEFGNRDHVFIGNNDFGAANGQTATLDVSSDGGVTFRSVRVERRTTSPSNAPSVRPTVARDGTVYVAFLGWRSFIGDGSSGTASGDVVVVRDDARGSGTAPFEALKDSDGVPGRLVATGRTFPWANPFPSPGPLGQERIGSSLSIAVDPNHSEIVYTAWGDRTGGDIYTLHLRRSTDRGVTWSEDLRLLHNATNPALAVAGTGTVGFLYQQVSGSGGSARWVTHLEQSRDGFAHSDDVVLSSTLANAPVMQGLPYLGDYNYLLATQGDFHGIFSASNDPHAQNFPSGMPAYQRRVDLAAGRLLDDSGATVPISIDPFYFRVAALQ
jgi:hypothetical protein